MDGDSSTFAWPDVPRLCFGPGPDWNLNACIGWERSQGHDMTGYVEGYRKAAVALFESAVTTNTSPDFLIIPMAFLWRQHVELALKDIIATGRRIAGQPWGFPPGHGLMTLWKEARAHIIQCGDPNAPELANVEANLREFEHVDPGADGFRYPFNRDRDARTLQRAPDRVNLRVLHEAMEALANFFEGVSSELSMRLDYVSEMEAEFGPE